MDLLWSSITPQVKLVRLTIYLDDNNNEQQRHQWGHFVRGFRPGKYTRKAQKMHKLQFCPKKVIESEFKVVFSLNWIVQPMCWDLVCLLMSTLFRSANLGSLFKRSSQENAGLISYTRRLIDRPSSSGYNFSHISGTGEGPDQLLMGQDHEMGKIVELFNGKKNGFFIECGALDGAFCQLKLNIFDNNWTYHSSHLNLSFITIALLFQVRGSAILWPLNCATNGQGC